MSAKTKDGKNIAIKYKKVGDNQIKIFSKVDTLTKIKLTVTPREPLEDKGWYKTAQSVARVMMMVRNVSISYRNNYSLSLPGFMPTVGNALGQTRGYGLLSPGLDFAFGMIDDSYIDKAKRNDWLLMSDSVATPATTNLTEDVQLRLTLEPVRNLKIDLVANRTESRAKSIQYMYRGNPTTQSGTFTMTTISLKGALSGIGEATNGFHSPTFEKFCNSLDAFRSPVCRCGLPRRHLARGKNLRPRQWWRKPLQCRCHGARVPLCLYQHGQRTRHIPIAGAHVAQLDGALQRTG